MDDDLLKAALWYAKHGWAVFPLRPRTKEPYADTGVYLATTDPDQIRAWWAQWPRSNIGIHCGASGIIAIDLDQYKDTYAGDDLLTRDLQETVTNLTGNGGTHLLYRMPAGKHFGGARKGLPTGIDVRGFGGYIVAPPSIHPNGQPYSWEASYGPHECELQPLPPFLETILDAAQQAKAEDVEFENRDLPKPNLAHFGLSTRIVQAIYEGQEAADRSEIDQSVITALVSRGATNDDILAVFNHFPIGQKGKFAERGERYLATSIGKARAYLNGSAPKPKAQAAPSTDPNASNIPIAEASSVDLTTYHLTDMGNAQRMHAAVRGQVIYVPQFDRWYIWRGTHWQEDDTFEIVRLAKRATMQIYAEAAHTDDDEHRKRLVRWAAHSEGRARLEAMIALLRSEPDIAVRPQALDQHPMWLACMNGTLNLATGELMEPDPAHLLTKRIDVAYDPDAECPLWEQFLHRIMAGNVELIAFLQRLIGHALTGDTSGKYLVFMYGPKGNNGKSTLVETIMRLLGPYAMKSPTEMVMAKTHRGGIPNDIARLRGVRFTVTNEVDEGMTLSESVVKDLTGNDTLTARFMRAEFFDFTPTHKLWIYGNHRPEIRGTDAAIWDRVKLIPFDVEIPKEERDPDMLDKLTAELPGILAWAVRGNMMWRKMGIAAPEIVAEATSEYQREQDTIGQFLTDCCDLGRDHSVGAGLLYQVYEAWAKQLGLRAESGAKFGADLSRRGFEMKRVTAGKMRLGLELNGFGRTLAPAPTPHWADER